MNQFNVKFFLVFFAVTVCSCLGFLFPNNVNAGVSMRSTTAAGGAFKRTSYFERNVGQTNSEALYFYPSAGYKLALFSNKAVITIPTFRSNQSHGDGPASVKKLLGHKESRKETRIAMQFLGANRSPRIRGEGELTGKSHYFLGKDQQAWRRNVPHYDTVVYEDLYPDVGLVFYSNEAGLEYDFILKPDADPGKIRFTFQGIDRLAVDAAGDLVLSFGGEELRLQRPKLYQVIGGHKVDVSGDYVVHDTIVGFKVAAYDHSLPLVIDPVLSYSTFLGGGGLDEGREIAVDADKNTYVTGVTDAFSMDGSTDIFVTKFDPSGQLVFLSFLGGTKDDMGNGISVDGAGNVYLAGPTASGDFPTTPGVVQPASLSNIGFGTGVSSFVAKISPTGSDLLYATFLSGGPQGDVSVSTSVVSGLAVDPSGNAYVVGSTTSPTFPVTPGAFQTTFAAASDAFIAKLNSDATQFLYATYLGGSGIDAVNSIAIDADGNAYVGGNTSSLTSAGGNDFPVKNALQPVQNGLSDGFVAKLDPAGSALVFSTYLGGSDNVDGIYGLAVDSQRNVLITGQTKSVDWPGAQNPSSSIETFGDGFVTKLSPAGDAILYSLFLGGYYFDNGFDLDVDPPGNAYVTGTTNSPDFPVTEDAYQEIQPGNDDLFVAKISPDGTILYATFLGGFTNDNGNGIAVGSPTEIYVTGAATSTDFPVVNAVQPQKAGFFDAVVAKLDLAAPVNTLAVMKEGDDATNIFTVITDPPGIQCGQYCTAANPHNMLGLPCNDFCTHNFDAGIPVKISVNPDPSLYPGWSYTLSGTGTDTVIMDQARTVTASFKFTYELKVNIEGNGKVTSDPAGMDCTVNCSGFYPANTIVTLTATPDSNAIFAGWGGEECSGTGTCVVTMNQARNVNATFTQKQLKYTLTVTKPGSGDGTVTSSDTLIQCGADCAESYSPNQVVTLAALPNKSNSLFAGWGGDCASAGTKPTCIVTMNGDKNVAPYFIANPTLSLAKAGAGKGRVRSVPKGIDCGIDCAAADGQFRHNSTARLTAKADQHSTFLGWSGDACSGSTKTTCTVSLNESKSVTALFGAPDISVSPTGYDFGDILVKTRSEPAVFTIMNNGTGDLKIAKIEITGTDASMFRAVAGGKKLIKPGAALDVYLTFRPRAIGVKGATLRIISNDPDEFIVEIPVSGGGK